MSFEIDYSRYPEEVFQALHIWNTMKGVLDLHQLEIRAELCEFKDITVLIHMLDVIQEFVDKKSEAERKK